jgi:hypothetical protein
MNNAGLSIQFTGNNLAEIGEFLGPTHYEYDGSKFIIPMLSGTLVLNLNDWLVKGADGLFQVEKPIIWSVIEPKKKKRGKKK